MIIEAFWRVQGEGAVMHKTILIMMAIFAIISCDCLTQDAAADGIRVIRHSRCGGYNPCVVYRRISCPDRFSCYSLYGAYGPYGGPAYWSRYSYGGLPYPISYDGWK
jgi:hypothetical protein